MSDTKGCIHLYHGDGKGKTTTAMGLALRYSSYGKQILVIQFLKSGMSGEISQLNTFENITVIAQSVTNSFSWEMTEEEKEATKALHHSFVAATQMMPWDMLVLDELCGALTTDLIDEALVEDMLSQRQPHQEIVITGRNPKDFLLDSAHYITEFKAVRHPFTDGLPAREGIEF